MGGSIKPPETLVLGAELYCEGSYGLGSYLFVADHSVEEGGLPAASVKDCIKGYNIFPFGGECLDGGLCTQDSDLMDLADEWSNPGEQKVDINGNKIITSDSFLVCKKKYKIKVRDSGLDGVVGSQLMILSELAAEFGIDFMLFLTDPNTSVYTPVDINAVALAFLESAMHKHEDSSIFLPSLYDKGPLGPVLLADIGKLAPYIDVSRLDQLLTGMENIITGHGGNESGADPRNLDTTMLPIMTKSCESYSRKVADGGFYKVMEENKALFSYFGEAATTFAYLSMMYSFSTGLQRKISYGSSYGRDCHDAQIGQANRGEGLNYRNDYVKLDSAGKWQYYDPTARRMSGYASVNEFDPHKPVTGPGQLHHVQSRPIMVEVKKNTNLRCRVNREDPQFKIRAIDRQSHNGYDKAHRIRDNKTINWLRENGNASYDEYIAHLNKVYSLPEQVERFGIVTFR